MNVKNNPEHLRLLENWMRGYKPEELFDQSGKLLAEIKEIAPTGTRRMGSNPHANGGRLKKALRLPDFRQYALKLEKPGVVQAENVRPLGMLLRDVMKLNMTNFRVFGPDETTSNKLDDIYEVSKKFWIEEYFPEDADGGELAPDGRVIEMLSEHTVEGMLEGYLLTGRHGFISSYESFVHVIDSMFNQHAKWLSICNHLSWRENVASLNLLITSTVWRQDHNGFTHQDPGFLDVVVNKSADRHAHLSSARREFPAFGGGPLPAQRKLRQRDRVRQADAPAISWTWMRRSSTAPRESASGNGPATTRGASRTW